ncbi:MAG: cyclic nucleotide-binding domain-containing protein [Alphaproteobacteria bacterium]|nr:cyclic nucleotide-binding domain-containing protein [Alphaproteobacteria bacterium]
MSKFAFQRAFQELTDEESEAIMVRARLLEFPAGAIILREGEPQTRIYVILDGAVRVLRLGQNGTEKELAGPLGPGDTLGEMSFVDDMGASATLIAGSDVVMKVITHQDVDALASQNDTFKERFYLSLLFTVVRRLRVLDYKMAFAD